MQTCLFSINICIFNPKYLEANYLVFLLSQNGAVMIVIYVGSRLTFRNKTIYYLYV